MLRGRAVLLGDFNAQSPLWDPFITQRKEAGPLETIIEDFDLILNNEQGAITRPGNKTKGSIIDLTFTTTELGLLDLWVIDEDDPTPSDHALILLKWADINDTCITYKGKQKGEITGWNINMLKQDPEALEKAKEEYLSRAIYRPLINHNNRQEDLENEAAWLEEILTKTLDKHAKPIRITAHSKRWWNPEVKEARFHYAKARRVYKLNGNKEEVKQARNSFYKILRKAKRICWQNFLQGTLEDDFMNSQKRC